MKKLFKNKFFIAFLLVGMVFLALMAWGLHKSKDTMGLKLDIPELQGEPVKSIHFENDSLVIQTVTILKDERFTIYMMLKSVTSKSLNELEQKQKFKVRATSYSETLGFKLWDYPSIINKEIDFGYYMKSLPMEEYKLSDTILIQKFKNMEIEMSLTEERERNLSIDIISPSPSTLVLYKKGKDLYFIAVNIPFGSDQFIPQDELMETVYLLVKNWDVYERR